MDALIQIDFDVVLKNKRHLYDEEIWDRMNEKACGQIRSCLTKEVKYEECVMTLWYTLEEKYLLKSPENHLDVMSQVYGFRMKSGVSMHDHVSRFEKLLADLKNLDEDIKDEVKAMILLHSLSEEYSYFVTTLIYGKSVIVFKDRWGDGEKEKRGGKNSRSKSRSRNITRDECDFCHEKVVMGNDQPCRTMGIGTIRLKMFYEMIRELKEVRYIPTLKKNLISVGALEAKGYKVTIENGTMKFTYGAMVILQGVWRYNLYYLKGGTTDEANVVEAHSDTTKLWHVRLGHAGEKSLQTLMRHGLLKDKNFWTEVVSYTSHLINRLPSAAIRGKTPMEMWFGKHAQDYNSLRIFGCPAYYHVKDGKLDPRARKIIFVGFKGGVKGFKFWDLEDKKFVCIRDVTFDKASMMKASSSQQVENKTKEVLQWVEFDATSYVPVSCTSEKSSAMDVTPRV
ncbi:hypothetical protein KPL70_002625 [Citrus sinensis]|uniref:Uncharacterized protein n=1 Tax=Citrus sinensis TaxID=2711 RepID=A0ACB8MWA9_CITSI|nr:hypothetical protein KPL70_002625 [Citrus sinensis]KAH9789923.1 hypothetical protein KPL71_003219 [Citrus sinensis]